MSMKAHVKMNMKAQLEEEMDLHVGDIVTVTELMDKDWCRYVTVTGFGVFEISITVFLTLDYLLIPWNGVLLEKLTGSQLFKKFPTFCGTRRFITAFPSAHHLSLS